VGSFLLSLVIHVFINNALVISLADPPNYEYLQGLLLEASKQERA